MLIWYGVRRRKGCSPFTNGAVRLGATSKRATLAALDMRAETDSAIGARSGDRLFLAEHCYATPAFEKLAGISWPCIQQASRVAWQCARMV